MRVQRSGKQDFRTWERCFKNVENAFQIVAERRFSRERAAFQLVKERRFSAA